ncbi:MAG: MTH938/NDUFAF3 family protein, partial [Candidatus Thorarchaeota archaeon]
DHGATVVILTQGFNERLQVPPETLQMLVDTGVGFHVLQTEEAIRVYNQLREHEQVGGLFHSTC